MPVRSRLNISARDEAEEHAPEHGALPAVAVKRTVARSRAILVPLLACAALTLGGCGQSPAPSQRGRAVSGEASGGNGGSAGSSDGVPGGVGGAGAAPGSGGSGPSLVFDGGLEPGSSGGQVGNGMPEICDGIDNDENGIIDDVDVGGDGVCDCLNIATIGQIGPWSSGGNIFATWLNERSPQGAVALDDQVLTPELLEPFQIVVALHVGTGTVTNGNLTAAAHHPFSAEESAAFKAWVEAGGGVMTTIGYMGDEVAEVVNINLLLNPIGMGYSTTAVDVSGFVQTWEPHPVSEGVRNIQAQNGVAPDGSGTVIATAPSGAPALEVAEIGQGRAVVWGDEWITYDSEWQDVDDQQVELFWLNILKWLSPPNECQVAIPPTVY